MIYRWLSDWVTCACACVRSTPLASWQAGHWVVADGGECLQPLESCVWSRGVTVADARWLTAHCSHAGRLPCKLSVLCRALYQPLSVVVRWHLANCNPPPIVIWNTRWSLWRYSIVISLHLGCYSIKIGWLIIIIIEFI